MTSTKFGAKTLSATLVTLLAGLAGQAQAQTTLSYATYFNANDPLVRVDRWFMEQVQERTNGAIIFDQYLGGALLGGPEIYPGMTRGAVDMGMSVPAAFQPTEYVLTNVTLPYVTDDSVSTTFAFNQLYDEIPALAQEYESRNIHLLYALGFPENNIWSNRPITTVEDLQGMRIRSVMSVANALELLGAVPVSMGFADAVAGLQRNLLDGLSSAPFLTTIAFGVHEFAPYVSDAGGMGVYAVSSTGMNLDTLSRLTPEQQAIIGEVASEAPGYYASIMSDLVSENVDALHEAGVTQVIVMSDEESARVRGIVEQPLWSAWINAADAAGHDGQAILDRYRELVAENEATRNYTTGLDLFMERYGNE